MLQAARERIPRPMPPPRKSKPVVIDLRTYQIARSIERIMTARGYSQTRLAAESGVDQSHLSKFLQGQKGIGVEQLQNVLMVLQSALHIEDGPPTGSVLIGTLSAPGRVQTFAGSVTMPGAFQVETGFGPFKAGDRVLVEAGAFTVGKWALVDDGIELRMMRCEERHGVSFLVGREAVAYEPELHKILGIAAERTERL